jgi:two-component sensor histidine kinase
VDFLRAADEAGKRAVVLRYVQTLDERDAHDRSLGALRLSLSALARTHEELAQGRQVSAAAFIQLVQDEYKAYQEQVEAIRKRREESESNVGDGT